MNGKRARRVKGVTAALVAAAVCVPAAQARVDEDAGQRPTPQMDDGHAALLRDRPVRPTGRVVSVVPVSTPDTTSDMEWGDAGIGAASMLGLTLLVGGGVLAGRRLASA